MAKSWNCLGMVRYLEVTGDHLEIHRTWHASDWRVWSSFEELHSHPWINYLDLQVIHPEDVPDPKPDDQEFDHE